MFAAQGCAVDGTMAAKNPISQLVDAVLDNRMAGGHMAGPRMGGGRLGAGQIDDLAAQFSEGMSMGGRAGGMRAMGARPGMGGAGAFMQQMGRGAASMGPMRMGHAAQRPGDWASEFAGGGGAMAAAGPQNAVFEDAFKQGMQAPAGMEAAWQAPPAAAAMQMEAAWAQQEAMMAQQQMEMAFQAEQQQAMMAQQQMEAAWQMEAAGQEAAWAESNAMQQAWQASAPMESAWAESQQGMDAAWQESKPMEAAWAESAATMDNAWRESAPMEAAWAEAQSGMAAAWAEAQGGMENAWLEAGQEDLSAAWAEAATGNQYEMAADNPYLTSEDPFSEGMALFDQGRLHQAILAFEAVVQADTNHSEGWRMLGQSHAEHDQDKLAIVCLERSVEEDPYNLNALLALGVSYVNELDSQRALKTLKAWVETNPKYAGLEVKVDEYSDGSLMDEVMQLMIAASNHGAMDADVQVVMGVLYNVSRDYDSATECFRNAVDASPDDYSLWNKLGATQANGSKSEAALPAYHRALELKPKYARGWLNLGISHANLGNHNEGARCYLQALNLNPNAKHIWSYLRIAFSSMGRMDLVTKTDGQDVASFKDEFNLFDL